MHGLSSHPAMGKGVSVFWWDLGMSFGLGVHAICGYIKCYSKAKAQENLTAASVLPLMLEQTLLDFGSPLRLLSVASLGTGKTGRQSNCRA